MRLTDISVRSLPLPQKGQKTYFDETLKGFGVRVSQGGGKSFVVMHGTDRRLTTIGRYPLISLQDARGEAKHLLAEKTLQKHHPTRIDFHSAFELFKTQHLQTKNKPSTANSTERRIKAHFWHLTANLEDISPSDISAVIDRLMKSGKYGEANHAQTAVATFLNWAVKRHYLIHSPCKAGLPSRYVPRDRLLSDREFVHVWRNCEPLGIFGSLAQILLVSGQRRNQIASLQASFIDYDARTITWPSSLMKGNKAHTIFYDDLTQSVLDKLPRSGLLFPARGKDTTPFSGFSKSKKQLDTACPIEQWSLHDARRFYSSTHAKLGTPIHLVERGLAHTGGTISGVAAVYNRYDFADELRRASKSYETYLARLLQDPCL